MILFFISIVLFISYSILIIYYWRAWVSLPEYILSNKISDIKLSVIIPARNEAKNIGDLLQAIELQDYPAQNFETIVIDDNSTDATPEVVKRYHSARLISLNTTDINSYKKKAIETGIESARYDWLITTDADCLPGISWLKTVASFREYSGSKVIAGPVSINCNNSVLQIFQSMDMMVLQGITGGALHRDTLTMCNGANLFYEKASFNAVNGFSGIDNIASGDDMLLLHKLRQNNSGKISYLKSKPAIVATEPMKSWKDFINQRIRWASKASRYSDKRIYPVMFTVYLFNLLFPVVLLFALFENQYWWLLFALLVGKTLVELPFFVSLSRFFDKPWTIKIFPFFQPLHIIYTVFTGLLGQMGTYEWKGRRVK